MFSRSFKTHLFDEPREAVRYEHISISWGLADQEDASVGFQALLEAAATRQPLVLEKLRMLGRLCSSPPSCKWSTSS